MSELNRDKRKFRCTRYNRFITDEEAKLLSDKLILSAKCNYLESVVGNQEYYLSNIFRFIKYRIKKFHVKHQLKKYREDIND